MKKMILAFACLVFICTSAAPVPAGEAFVIGVPPFTDPGNIQTSFQPITDHIGKVIGLPTRLEISKSYDAFAGDVVSGKISIGFSTSVLYVKTKKQHPDDIFYVATCKQAKGGKARTFYYGFFLVSKNSPYKSLGDLKGKKWGFTNRKSSSGYQYPMVFFSNKGLNPDTYFSEVKFLKKHPKITDALAAWKNGQNNIIDGGATWDVNLWEAETKHGKVFRKIARVGPIPMQPVVVPKKVYQDKALLEKIKTALTRDVPEAAVKVKGFPYSGWEIGSDRDFDIVRKVVKRNEGE